MAGVLQADERSRPEADSRAAPPAAQREPDRAQAFLVAGLTWTGVVLASWLVWWLIGDQGREGLAGTVGLSATQLAPYVVAALVAEKLAAKALLFAALYHWLKGRRAAHQAAAGS